MISSKTRSMSCVPSTVASTPAAVKTTPRITASASAAWTLCRRSSLSLAPKALEIRIVAPAARPFMKFSGNLNSVSTELMAARPFLPVNCPTMTESVIV